MYRITSELITTGINITSLSIRTLFLITIAFITNPRKGGSPPKDKNINTNKNLSYNLDVCKNRKFIFKGLKKIALLIYIYILL